MPAAPLRAAGILFRADDGRVLLVERDDGSGWAFPGGKVEPGESEEEAAVREAKEELGGFPDGPREFFARQREGDVLFTTFIQRVAESFDPPRLREHVAFKWVTPDEALGVEDEEAVA